MNKKRYGYQVVSSKVEYENPFMIVHRQEVIRPDGKTKPYWVLDRGGDFSVIIPFFPDNSTIIVGQYRVPTGKYLWEFSMGMVKGATPLGTAQQELREETGLRAKKWSKIGSFYLAPGFSAQRSHVYVAQDITIGKSEPEEDEYISTKRLPLSKVKEMIQKGDITDGPTIIAFHMFEQKGFIKL